MGFTVGVRLGFGVGADEVGLAVGLGLGAAPSTSASMPTVNSAVNSDNGVMAEAGYRIFRIRIIYIITLPTLAPPHF